MRRGLAICAFFLALPLAGADTFVEYGHGSFSETGTWLFLGFPDLTIRNDGRLIFMDEFGVWTATVPEARMERLRRDLSHDPLLRETHFYESKHAKPIMMHGGMSYIRFGDVIIAAEGLPVGGAWQRVIDRIREEIPSSYESYLPPQIRFDAVRQWTAEKHVRWPFEHFPLSVLPGDTTDPAIIAFVMRQAFRRDVWRYEVDDATGSYFLSVTHVSDWASDRSSLAMEVELLRQSGEGRR